MARDVLGVIVQLCDFIETLLARGLVRINHKSDELGPNFNDNFQTQVIFNFEWPRQEHHLSIQRECVPGEAHYWCAKPICQESVYQSPIM